jgi:hypothetical protein
MSLTVEAGQSLDIDQIYGHDFRVSLISRCRSNCDNYELDNLHLISGFEGLIPRLRNKNIPEVCQCMNETYYNGNLNGQILYDPESGIITQISLDLPNTQSSRVSLDQDFIAYRSGVYRSENIQKLSTAITYQKFISEYLSFMSDLKIKYSYIERYPHGFGSRYLSLPNYDSLKNECVTNEHFQNRFLLRANFIAGQFSEPINYLKYNDNGFLKIIQLSRGGDCIYTLNTDGVEKGRYSAHNVDHFSDAATLHGIAAEFINEIITRTEDKNND